MPRTTFEHTNNVRTRATDVLLVPWQESNQQNVMKNNNDSRVKDIRFLCFGNGTTRMVQSEVDATSTHQYDQYDAEKTSNEFQRVFGSQNRCCIFRKTWVKAVVTLLLVMAFAGCLTGLVVLKANNPTTTTISACTSGSTDASDPTKPSTVTETTTTVLTTTTTSLERNTTLLTTAITDISSATPIANTTLPGGYKGYKDMSNYTWCEEVQPLTAANSKDLISAMEECTGDPSCTAVRNPTCGENGPFKQCKKQTEERNTQTGCTYVKNKSFLGKIHM